jgi:hypothetical protein
VLLFITHALNVLSCSLFFELEIGTIENLLKEKCSSTTLINACVASD